MSYAGAYLEYRHCGIKANTTRRDLDGNRIEEHRAPTVAGGMRLARQEAVDGEGAGDDRPHRCDALGQDRALLDDVDAAGPGMQLGYGHNTLSSEGCVLGMAVESIGGGIPRH